MTVKMFILPLLNAVCAAVICASDEPGLFVCSRPISKCLSYLGLGQVHDSLGCRGFEVGWLSCWICLGLVALVLRLLSLHPNLTPARGCEERASSGAGHWTHVEGTTPQKPNVCREAVSSFPCRCTGLVPVVLWHRRESLMPADRGAPNPCAGTWRCLPSPPKGQSRAAAAPSVPLLSRPFCGRAEGAKIISFRSSCVRRAATFNLSR